MNIGEYYYLLEDCKNGRRELYAAAGKQVKLISTSDPACVVEFNENRFPTTLNNLTNEKKQSEQIEEVLPARQVAKRRDKIRPARTNDIPTSQSNTLF